MITISYNLIPQFLNHYELRFTMLGNLHAHIGARNKYARHDGHGIYCRYKLFLIQDGRKYAIDNVNAICARSCATSLGPTWEITDVTLTLDFEGHSEFSHSSLGRTPPELEQITCRSATARVLSPEHLTLQLTCQLKARRNAQSDTYRDPMACRLMIWPNLLLFLFAAPLICQ